MFCSHVLRGINHSTVCWILLVFACIPSFGFCWMTRETQFGAGSIEDSISDIVAIKSCEEPLCNAIIYQYLVCAAQRNWTFAHFGFFLFLSKFWCSRCLLLCNVLASWHTHLPICISFIFFAKLRAFCNDWVRIFQRKYVDKSEAFNLFIFWKAFAGRFLSSNHQHWVSC